MSYVLLSYTQNRKKGDARDGKMGHIYKSQIHALTKPYQGYCDRIQIEITDVTEDNHWHV